MQLFNEKKFFEAHEELEQAWRQEKGELRNLYKGILQAGVTYLHISRGNYEGAVKVYGRSMKLLNGFPEVYGGIRVGKLRHDLQDAVAELEKLGKGNLKNFSLTFIKPVEWSEGSKKVWICDRCGRTMVENNCKVTCQNCGNRFDCSDLNMYFD